MAVNISPDEINRLKSFVVGNPAYINLSLRRWSPINDDPNYEIKKVLYIDENNMSRQKIIVKRRTDLNNLSADAYSILFNFQETGGKKTKKRKRKNKKSRRRKNKKSRRR